MTDLTEAYEDKRKDGEILDVKIYADAVIFKGALTCVLSTDGWARTGGDTTSYVLMGVAVENSPTVVSGESSGDRSFRVFRTGTFKFHATGTATQSWVGKQVYISNDNTVGLRNSVTHGILAGICVEYIDSTHVRVDILCTTQTTWAEESWSSSSSSSSTSTPG